jgi:hypothetical protein
LVPQKVTQQEQVEQLEQPLVMVTLAEQALFLLQVRQMVHLLFQRLAVVAVPVREAIVVLAVVAVAEFYLLVL